MEVAKSHSRTLSRLLRNDTRDWWEQALTTHRAEFLGKLREILETTTETQDGCLEVATKTPKRVTWKGKRLYAYQLLCVASQSVLPRQDEVVRRALSSKPLQADYIFPRGVNQKNVQPLFMQDRHFATVSCVSFEDLRLGS